MYTERISAKLSVLLVFLLVLANVCVAPTVEINGKYSRSMKDQQGQPPQTALAFVPVQLTPAISIIGNTYLNFSLDLNTDDVKYLTIYTRAQYAAITSASAQARYNWPSYRRYEFKKSIFVETAIDFTGFYYFYMWVPPTGDKNDVTYAGKVFYEQFIAQSFTLEDANLYIINMYLFGAYGLLLVSYSMIMNNPLMKRFPIPWMMFALILLNFLSYGFYYAYYWVREQLGSDTIALYQVANIFGLSAQCTFYYVGCAFGLGWTITERSIALREQGSLFGVITLYFLLGFIQQFFFDDLFAQTMLQLGMEFFRIIISFVLNIAAYATTVRLRQRTAMQEGDIDKVGALNSICVYHRYNVLVNVRNIVPITIILPTLLLFIRPYLYTTESWFHVLFIEMFNIMVYSFISYWMYPKTYDVTGLIRKSIKDENGNHSTEMFVPHLFTTPTWTFFAEDTGLWIALARNIETTRMRAINEMRRMTPDVGDGATRRS